MYYLVRHTAAQAAPPCTWSCSTYAAGSDRRYAATDTEPGKGLVRLELDIYLYLSQKTVNNESITLPCSHFKGIYCLFTMINYGYSVIII